VCGIVAYVGEKQASGIVLDCLRKLEYRGYDSAGIATLHDGKIEVRKGAGKVDDVERKMSFRKMHGQIGIGHTRWATTGRVNDMNAHPHLSSDGRFAIVQNGIVENYQDLKDNLQKRGFEFSSETDTEVIVKLIESFVKEGKSPLVAIQKTFQDLHGRNTFVLLDAMTGRIYAARKGSPLILGIASGALLLSSDVPALLEHTRDVVFIDDDELVEITGNDAYAIYNIKTLAKKRKGISHVTWTLEQAQKGDHPHFMIKEILEQRHTIADAIAQDKRLIGRVAGAINGAFGTYIVGCGTAGKVALAATYLFSRIAGKHLNFALGSEFPNYHAFLTDRSLLIAISQSGETADTLEAIDVAKSKGGKIVSVVNALGSTMDRISDHTIPVNAGPEKAVCSTKATTGQLAIMALLAYAVVGKYEEGVQELKKTARAVDEMLTPAFLEKIREVARRLVRHEHMYIIGRGANYPIALEAAIKIQEVSYVHAEGFAGGELKHGPIALIAKGTPLIALVPNDETREDTITNALEVKTRGGLVIGIAPQNNDAFDIWIPVPDVPVTSPIVNIIPVQLLAYELAVLRGNDVDMPRNLAKSVTVK
jgi:glucosamine--fructose-6-phosphate aminotransferase (isomerizing)